MSTPSDGLDGRLAPLSVGTRAPDLALLQAPNRVLRMRGLVNHAVILAFYPMDWELVSREQLTLYQSFAPAFDRLSACLLGISVDSVHCHAAFARDAQLRFPLLADFHPRGLVARRYGVY